MYSARVAGLRIGEGIRQLRGLSSATPCRIPTPRESSLKLCVSQPLSAFAIEVNTPRFAGAVAGLTAILTAADTPRFAGAVRGLQGIAGRALWVCNFFIGAACCS